MNMVYAVDPALMYLRVDQVVVDTLCVPEPATMSLLALGGLALIRRKRLS